MATGSPKERVNIIEIAAAAGVFKSTVSLALKGSESVHPAVRERVNAAIRGLGYVYNLGASDRAARSNIVGMSSAPFIGRCAASVVVRSPSARSDGHDAVRNIDAPAVAVLLGGGYR